MHSSSRRSFLGAGLALPVLGASAGEQSTSQTAPKAFPQQQPVARYRTLGRTGLKVSEVGFGSEAVSDVTVYEHALDLGITFFDTAHDYQNGNAEIALGKGLGARRKDVVVCGRSYGSKPESLARDLDASLKALNTDYFDIWYIGAKDQPAHVTDEMLEFQNRAQKDGKIRFKGLSTHRLQDMTDFIVARKQFDVVLTVYNFARGAPRDYFGKYMPVENLAANLQRIHDAGIGLVAMKVMAGGYKPRDSKEALYEIHQRPNAHLAALKWALRDKRFATTIPRMADHDQLVENVRAMGATYTDEDDRTLSMHLTYIGGKLCRMCGACDGECPRGLPVADMVRFVTYAEGYGNFGMGHSRFTSLPSDLREVRCDGCRECVVHCPYGVHVKESVARAQYLFS